MKKLLLLALLLPVTALAQHLQNQWIWIDGSKNEDERVAEFALTGVEHPLNWPDHRNNTSSIVDNNGNLLMFGGKKYLPTTNELWSFNHATNNWTWKKGRLRDVSAPSVSIQLGIEDYRNEPCARTTAQMWKDSEGNMWLFGGNFSQSFANDMWKYNSATNNWTQISIGTEDNLGNFGTIGVTAATNIPPATAYATTWTDNSGNLWMFGGNTATVGNMEQPSGDNFNSLWKFSPATGMWTWISGSQESGQAGTYAMQGSESAANMPGARANAAGWIDTNGHLCFFGGSHHNDIWKYNPSTNLWNWIKGGPTSSENIATTGTEDPANLPMGTPESKLLFWKDTTGTIWYYDGSYYNRMWRYNPVTNNWALIKEQTSEFPIFAGVNTSDASNTPGIHTKATTWTGTNGDLYLFSGDNEVNTNNLIKYVIATNAWILVRTATTTVYATSGTLEYQHVTVAGNATEEAHPGYMEYSTAEWNDSDGNLWVYGLKGENYGEWNFPSSDHLWKYNSTTRKWQWINGVFHSDAWYDQRGTLGVESPMNNPRPRRGSMSWRDNDNNLYLFGGISSEGILNDLWKYNQSTNNWVWISGSATSGSEGDYGQQGVAASSNQPPARRDGVTWTDADGNLYLFGGTTTGAQSYFPSTLNDTWKYNLATNQWTWLRGSNQGGQYDESAGDGIEAATNTPGSATHMVSWKGLDGTFWLFAGSMWKYNGTNWIKVRNFGSAVYGTLGIYNDTNSPGGRLSASTWVDQDGNLVLFGNGSATSKIRDMWKYNISLNQWAWIGGKKNITGTNPIGNYGEINEAFISNLPGGRANQVSWQDNDFNFYLFGGSGFDENSEGNLSDVWVSNRKFNTLAGNVKFGTGDCATSTINVPNVKINMVSSSGDKFTFTNPDGNYQEITDDPTVTLTPELLYYTFTPASQTVNLTGYGSTQTTNFCASATVSVTDLDITILPLNAAVPGFDARYKIIYKNKGTLPASGTVAFEYDEAKSEFISSTVTPMSQSAGELSWNYASLEPFESRSHEVTLNINTPTDPNPVNDGDVLSATAVINAATGDQTTDDNIFTINQDVINSMDPNDKTCLEGALLSPAQIGDYVNYMIRFENMGTAAATHIVVTDMIDTSKFDIETIQPVDASHAYRMVISEGNNLAFHFENINLPFAPSVLRHGFVVFKIRTKAILEEGDTFSNLANIYFDYNYPVVTNDYVSTFGNDLNINEPGNPAGLVIYPNPVKNVMYFKSDNVLVKAEIYDIHGRIIRSAGVENNAVDTSGLASGIYIVKTYSQNEMSITKIVKE